MKCPALYQILTACVETSQNSMFNIFIFSSIEMPFIKKEKTF